MNKFSAYILTGKLFDQLDYSEAVICLDYSLLHLPTIHVGLWGIVFHLNHYPFSDGPLLDDGGRIIDMAYLPAWCKMTFHEVHQVDLQLRPYRPSFSGRGDFVASSTEEQALRQVWKTTEQLSLQGTYDFDCVLEHPYGYCSLTINASGMVKLAFQRELLVPFAKYEADPTKCGWWSNGRLHGRI